MHYNTAYKPTEQDGSPDVDYWTPENQDAKFPRPGIASQNDMPALAFEKASFLKLREVTLAYNLPRSLISKGRDKQPEDLRFAAELFHLQQSR